MTKEKHEANLRDVEVGGDTYMVDIGWRLRKETHSGYIFEFEPDDLVLCSPYVSIDKHLTGFFVYRMYSTKVSELQVRMLLLMTPEEVLTWLKKYRQSTEE